MAAPDGWQAICDYYSLPTRDSAGHVTAQWIEDNLIEIPTPFSLTLSWDPRQAVNHIRCHRKIADALNQVLNEINEGAPYLGRTLGAWLGEDYGGCYCDRAIRGSGRFLSMHAFGAALDFRVVQNPLGGKPEEGMQKLIVPIFQKHGFTWGGDFARKDPQHFQYASGY